MKKKPIIEVQMYSLKSGRGLLITLSGSKSAVTAAKKILGRTIFAPKEGTRK